MSYCDEQPTVYRRSAGAASARQRFDRYYHADRIPGGEWARWVSRQPAEGGDEFLLVSDAGAYLYAVVEPMPRPRLEVRRI